MTELAHKSSVLRLLSDEESVLLKRELVRMYHELSNLCLSNGLDLIMVGGSALGAARHNGFIPWDDDLDVGLLRDQYEKLIELLRAGKMGEKYEFTFPSKDNDSKNTFLKLYRKGSKNIEIYDIHTPFPKGIYIDIFPIDYAIQPSKKSFLKSLIADIIAYVSNSVIYFEYDHNEYKNFMFTTHNGRISYWIRYCIGKLCGIIPHKKWVLLFDNFVKSSQYTDYVTIASGRKGYYGETLKTEMIIPPSKAIFEGMEVKVPNNLDAYLTNLYGNYMSIPPVEKRERHYIVDIDFP